MAENKMKFSQEAQAILEEAKRYDMESDFLFRTTFERYTRLLQYLEEIEEKIENEGIFTDKEYVKGRPTENRSAAYVAYTQTCSACDKTVKTLASIIKTLRKEKAENEKDPLLEALGMV